MENGEKKNVRITVSLPRTIREAIAKAVARTNLTQSEFMIQAIEKQVARESGTAEQ